MTSRIGAEGSVTVSERKSMVRAAPINVVSLGSKLDIVSVESRRG